MTNLGDYADPRGRAPGRPRRPSGKAFSCGKTRSRPHNAVHATGVAPPVLYLLDTMKRASPTDALFTGPATAVRYRPLLLHPGALTLCAAAEQGSGVARDPDGRQHPAVQTPVPGDPPGEHQQNGQDEHQGYVSGFTVSGAGGRAK